jgi:hypothetical protein
MNLNPVGWTNQTSLRQPLPVVGWNAPTSYTGPLLNLQQAGTTRFSIASTGDISLSNGNGTLSTSTFFLTSTLTATFASVGVTSVANLLTNYGLALETTRSIGWASNIASSATVDLALIRDAADVLAQRRGTNANTFRVYNTYTSSTNYERAKLEWSSNVLNIGTEKGSGGGTARSMALQTDATDRLALDTTGSVRVVTALTVATLPASPTVGMIARVTNALSPTIGSTVAGGGSANALCWYNGTNWTVLGI